MPKPTTVAEYTAALPEELRAVTDRLVPLIDAVLPGAGKVWHGHPVWGPATPPVAYLKAYGAYVAFGFWQGQRLTDPSGRLEAAAREMAAVKLRTPADIDAALFTAWLEQARDLT
ncbi:DUF1801 domain-containing protein [Streptomyces avicenniae]|uniref:DUF1801 domain-containing protein n=1 Tax=Streptomyces avicenniae TaxID=500153 RepID=UPI00069C95BB|nr:DUF1801 domain-containing protein [Streptomyces avicenniae]